MLFYFSLILLEWSFGTKLNLLFLFKQLHFKLYPEPPLKERGNKHFKLQNDNKFLSFFRLRFSCKKLTVWGYLKIVDVVSASISSCIIILHSVRAVTFNFLNALLRQEITTRVDKKLKCVRLLIMWKSWVKIYKIFWLIFLLFCSVDSRKSMLISCLNWTYVGFPSFYV